LMNFHAICQLIADVKEVFEICIRNLLQEGENWCINSVLIFPEGPSDFMQSFADLS
jgi:hypothetical protein